MFRKNAIMKIVGIIAVALVLMVAGCESDDEKTPTNGNTPTTNNADLAAPPRVAMELPQSMTPARPAGAALTTNALGVNQTNHDGPDCDFGSENDAFENGYTMTKFLAALSQNQSCFADWLIQIVTTNAQQFIGAGKIAITDDNDPDAPTFIQIEKSTDGNTLEIWLFNDVEGVDPSLYLTWTSTSATDASGSLVWDVDGGDGNGGPSYVRTDFSRSAEVDVNTTYMLMPDADPNNMAGFRVELTRTGTGTDTVYTALGRLAMNGQWNTGNLPALTGVIYGTPVITMNTIANADGLGGAQMNFEHWVFHLGPLETDAAARVTAQADYETYEACKRGLGNNATDADILAACGENSFLINLGTYDITLTDWSYFLADGTNEWVAKGPSAATYINNAAGDNDRWGIDFVNGAGNLWIVSGTQVNFIDFYLSCLETGAYDLLGGVSACEGDVNDPNNNGIPDMNLGSGYFTDPAFTNPPVGGPCTNTDGADCLDFVDQLFDSDGWMGDVNNDAVADQPDDFRTAYFSTATPLDSVWPAGQDSTTTFDMPLP